MYWDGRGMPDESKTSVIVPILKRKGDVMSCGSYRGVKLLEHDMKIVEKVLERRTRMSRIRKFALKERFHICVKCSVICSLGY